MDSYLAQDGDSYFGYGNAHFGSIKVVISFYWLGDHKILNKAYIKCS